MKILKPGDLCPCCGQPLKEGLSRDVIILLSWIAAGKAVKDAARTGKADSESGIKTTPIAGQPLSVLEDKVWKD